MTKNQIMGFMVGALGLAVAIASCRSTTTGNEGNLSFGYVADDDLFDFNKPIAVGARLDLRVTPAGTGTGAVTLTAASTDDPDALSVVAFEGDVVTVEGLGAGNVLITVEATLADGTTVSDGVNMNVRVPEVHRLAHTCGASGGAYLTGSSVYVPYELEMNNGRAVIGYGYYPVTSSDETLFVRDEAWDGVQFMRFDTLAAGAATLTSDIDGTTLDVTIIEEAALDGVADPIAFVLEDIDVGDINPFYVLPTTAGTTVCQADATLEVVSDTPTICDVRTTTRPLLAGGDAEHENGWFEIEGLAAGDCEYTVTYPNGDGASAQFTFPIQP